MADLEFHNVGISAIAAAVPATVFDNLTAGSPFTAEEAAAVVEKTGIRFRRIAAERTCASDLCHAAAERLIADNEVDRSSIDVLIFVSQTPDYRMPATSIILQDRLGLSTKTLALDISLGCTGFIYGLSVAFSFAQQPSIRKVLLLNGETRTKVYSSRDRSTGLLFGDAGSAVLIEKDSQFGSSRFSLYSDGSRFDDIIVPAGACRNPSSEETLKERSYPCGSIRNAEHGTMQGANVFEFVLIDVAKSIREWFKAEPEGAQRYDYYVLHQANRFMNEHLRRRLDLEPSKVPYSLDEFGNTSSVSIPLTIVTRLTDVLQERPRKLFLSGWGVGLSWAHAGLQTMCPRVSPLVEYRLGK